MRAALGNGPSGDPRPRPVPGVQGQCPREGAHAHTGVRTHACTHSVHARADRTGAACPREERCHQLREARPPFLAPPGLALDRPRGSHQCSVWGGAPSPPERHPETFRMSKCRRVGFAGPCAPRKHAPHFRGRSASASAWEKAALRGEGHGSAAPSDAETDVVCLSVPQRLRHRPGLGSPFPQDAGSPPPVPTNPSVPASIWDLPVPSASLTPEPIRPPRAASQDEDSAAPAPWAPRPPPPPSLPHTSSLPLGVLLLLPQHPLPLCLCTAGSRGTQGSWGGGEAHRTNPEARGTPGAPELIKSPNLLSPPSPSRWATRLMEGRGPCPQPSSCRGATAPLDCSQPPHFGGAVL